MNSYLSSRNLYARFLRKAALLPAFALMVVAAAAQSPEAYIVAHKQDITNGVTAGSLLDDAFFNHTVFLLGESHGIQKPQELDLGFLKLLNARAGVRTYIGEFDFAKAYYLNQYLRTGNEKLLDTVFSDWAAHYEQWGNKDFQQKIRNIRALNQGLPARRQIHFAGLDGVHNPGLAADYFTEVLSPPLRPQFAPLIKALRNGEDSLAALEAAGLLTKLSAQRGSGTRQATYQQVLYGLYVCSAMHTPGREAALYHNFKYLYEHAGLKGEKLYGLWGFAHVLQAGANGGKVSSLAMRLAGDSSLGLQGKIVSIACLYSGSRMMMPTQYLPPMWQDTGKRYTASDKFNNDGDMMNVTNLHYFKDATQPGSATLFGLAGPGSPFNSQAVSIKYSPFMPASQQMRLDAPGKYLADYMQYLILVRNSPATRPVIE